MTVTGFVTNSDKLDVKGINNYLTTAWGSTSTLEVNNLAVITSDTITLTEGKLGTAANALTQVVTSANAFSQSGQKTYIAIAASGGTNVYEITNDATQGLGADDTVKLIATVSGSTLVAGDFTYTG